MKQCDECGKRFLPKDMVECPLEDESLVCKNCCEGCLNNVAGECELKEGE